VDREGELLRTAAEAGLERPAAVAYDEGNGRLYVADSAGHRVAAYGPDGARLLSWGSRGIGDGEFNHPTHLALDRAGNLLVTDALNFRVQAFDREGRSREVGRRTSVGARSDGGDRERGAFAAIACRATGLALMLSWALLFPTVTAAQTQIVRTLHNLTPSGPGTFRVSEAAGLCVFCHTPHNASPTRALFTPKRSAHLFVGERSQSGADRGPAALRPLEIMLQEAAIALGNAELFTEISEAHERLAAIMAGVTDQMVILDREMRVVWTNPATAAEVGGSAVGLACFELMGGTPETCQGCPAVRTFNSGTVARGMRARTCPDGKTKYLDLITTPLRDASGRVHQVLEVARDITEMVEMEERLKHSNQALLGAQSRLVEKERLAAIGQVVVGLHHAILNPLTGILGALQVLKHEDLGQPERAQAVAEAAEEIRKIEALVKRLPDLRRVAETPYVGGTTMVDLERSCSEGNTPVPRPGSRGFFPSGGGFPPVASRRDVLRHSSFPEFSRLLPKVRWLPSLASVLPRWRRVTRSPDRRRGAVHTHVHLREGDAAALAPVGSPLPLERDRGLPRDPGRRGPDRGGGHVAGAGWRVGARRAQATGLADPECRGLLPVHIRDPVAARRAHAHRGRGVVNPWATTTLGGLLLYLSLFWVVRISHRIQIRAEAGRRKAEAELLRLNQELEQRVVDRTAAVEAARRELEASNASVSRLLEESERRRQRVGTLVAVSRRLTAELDLPALLGSIAKAAAEIFEGEAGFRLAEGEFLVRVGATPGAMEVMSSDRIRIGESISGRVAATARPYVTADTAADSHLRNYWEQIETYVGERSQATFSQGICPDCRATVVEKQLEEWRQRQR